MGKDAKQGEQLGSMGVDQARDGSGLDLGGSSVDGDKSQV